MSTTIIEGNQIEEDKKQNKKRSSIWQYIKQINETILKCTICNKEYEKNKYYNSTLSKHLKTHGLILLVDNDPKDDQINCIFCNKQFSFDNFSNHFKRFFYYFKIVLKIFIEYVNNHFIQPIIGPEFSIKFKKSNTNK